MACATSREAACGPIGSCASGRGHSGAGGGARHTGAAWARLRAPRSADDGSTARCARRRLMTRDLGRTAALLAALLIGSVAPRAAGPIRVMLLDGESGGPYHKWQATTVSLKKQLDDGKLFDAEG